MKKGGIKKAFATGGVVTSNSNKDAGKAQRAARDASFGKQMLGRLQGIVAARGASPSRTVAINALTKNPNMTPEQLAQARDPAKPANVRPVQKPNVSGGPGSPAVRRMKTGGEVKKKFADGGAVVSTSLPSDPRMAARLNRMAARGRFSDTPNPNPMNPVTGRPGRGGSPPSGGTMGPMGQRSTYADKAASAYVDKAAMGLKKGGEVKSKMMEGGMAEKKKKMMGGGMASKNMMGMKKGGMAKKGMKKGLQPADAILLHILVPNYEVAPNYQTLSVVTQDGRSLSGWLAAESESSLTLRTAAGGEESIARSQLTSLVASGLSLMPDGLEQTMAKEDMANLVSFLKSEN
jgi:putative heme-binding domain-containing protein